MLDRPNFDPGSSGILSPGRFLKSRALLWGTLLFGIILGFFFASVMSARWLDLRGNWFYLPAIALPLVACGVYAMLVRKVEKRTAWEIQVTPTSFLQSGIGFLFGGVYIAGMWVLLLSARLCTMRHGIWTHWFSDMVFDSYISAVLEELAFRAILLRIFARI